MTVRLVTGLALLGLILAGCDQTTEQTAETTRKLPDWMTEGDAASATDASPFEGASPFDEESGAKLALQLKPGDRFPLRKIVRQELIQSTLTGQPVISQSQLEIMFAINVEEVTGGRIKLAVKYDRVKYQHDVAGERVVFDSTMAQQNLPVGVWAYRDMVGEGFKFWLGEDNQIVEVEGFTDFLKKCTRNVPEELKSTVMLGIEAGSGEDGIANFVDNSIGLLPYGTSRKPGDTWDRPRFISRPVPMQIQNQYTLSELTGDEAVVTIRGTIAPAAVGTASADSAQVEVLGGSTQGKCRIYRSTGLPKESQVERVVDMVVRLPAAEFRQQKKITTTIESFPVTSGGSVLQVGYQQ